MEHPTINPEFQGTVEFDIYLDGKFENVNLKGKYPRIKPAVEREDLNPKDLELLQSRLMDWVQKHFDVSQNLGYFQTITHISTVLAAYNDPWVDLWSKESDLQIKLMTWAWLLDDFFEDVTAKKTITVGEMREMTNTLLEVMTSNIPSPPAYPSNELIRPYFESLCDIQNLFVVIVPNFFSKCHLMVSFEKKYYKCIELYLKFSLDEICSDQMFRYWRNISFRYDWHAAATSLIHDTAPSQSFFKSPAVYRILELTNSYGALANDILGIKKDIEQNEPNLVLFKVKRSGMSLEDAVKEVSGTLVEELEEYILLRKFILESYLEDTKVRRFLNILDSLMDGHNRIYGTTNRYYSADSVKLNRNLSHLGPCKFRVLTTM